MGRIEQDLLRHIEARNAALMEQKGKAAAPRVSPDLVQPQPSEGATAGANAAPTGWKGAGVLGTLGLILLKFKSLLLLGLTKIQFIWAGLKLLSLGKIALVGGSMLASLWAYAQFAPLPMATGFVLLILVHELGHSLALRHYGVKASVPVFIPFAGAFIALKEMPKDVRIEAVTALAGPVLGTAGALVCYRVWEMNGSQLFLNLAFVGFLLNLANLAPFAPLDGGRVAKAVSPSAWWGGLALMAVVMLAAGYGEYLVLVILLIVLSLPMMLSQWRQHGQTDYQMLAPRVRTQIAVAYFVLAGGLMLYIAAAHKHMIPPT